MSAANCIVGKIGFYEAERDEERKLLSSCIRLVRTCWGVESNYCGYFTKSSTEGGT